MYLTIKNLAVVILSYAIVIFIVLGCLSLAEAEDSIVTITEPTLLTISFEDQHEELIINEADLDKMTDRQLSTLGILFLIAAHTTAFDWCYKYAKENFPEYFKKEKGK